MPEKLLRNQLIPFREERDLGQKINATFGFIRQNFKPLMKCLLYIVAPWAMVGGIFAGISQYRLVRGMGEYDSWGEYAFGRQITSVHYLVAIFFMVVSFVLVGITVSAYIVEYMDNDGKVEFAAVRDRVKASFLPVFGATLGVFLLCMLGMVFLILPGIYLSVLFSMYIIVMVREDLGFVEALERSRDMVKGYWWSTFGFILVISLLQSLMAFVTNLPAYVVNMMIVAQVPGFDSQIVSIIANSLANICNVLFYSISVIGLAFQYFNLVEKKEGVGYLALADQIGAQQEVSVTEEDEY